MKIPNLDTNVNEKQKIRLNNFLDEEYRMLVAGQSGCGKTNTVMYMLKKPLVHYDQIYLYTHNTHQDKMQDLIRLMDEISQKVGYDVLEIKGQDEIRDTTDYQEGNRKIVIFDDLVNAPACIRSKIANHFTDGRHHQISPIYLTQSYYDTPQKKAKLFTYDTLYSHN